MKTRLLAFASYICVTISCLASSYTITIPGFTISSIANQLDNGLGNTLDQLFPAVPDGSQIYKWDCSLQDFSPTVYTYSTVANQWSPSGTLSPGEGALFYNSGGGFNVTFTGTPVTPVYPDPFACPCGEFSMISGQTPTIGSWQSIVGSLPTEGAQFLRWDVALQQFDQTNVFTGCQWTLGNPSAEVGETVMVYIPCNGSNCPCTPPPPNMSAWWTFDESAGPIANDIAGAVNNKGTYFGTPIPSGGVVNNALCFGGTNNYVMVTNQAEINFVGACTNNGTNILESFTIDAWIRAATNGPAFETLLDKRAVPVGSPRGYSLFLTNGHLGFLMADGSAASVASLTPDLRDSQWHFIAVVVQRCNYTNGNGGALYVDASQVVSFPDLRTGNLNNTANLYIGRTSPSFGTGFYQGCIDELEFYKRTLSFAELQAIYVAGSAGKCRCTNSLTLTCATNKTVLSSNSWSFDPPTPYDPSGCTNITVIPLGTTTNYSDPCNPVISQVWQAMGCCASVAACTQMVTVVDVTPPSIVSVSCDSNGICVLFDEQINSGSVDPFAFEVQQWTGSGYAVSDPQTATLQPDGRTVCLTDFSPPLLGSAQWAYLYVFGELSDLCGNTIGNTNFGFCCPGYVTVTNDSCSNCIPIALGGTQCAYTGGGATFCASSDGLSSCGINASHDVWYCLMVSCPTTVQADTCGSTFDTVLSVHSGCPGTTTNQITCDDDDVGGCAPQSKVSFSAVPGQTYRIRVAGKNGATGIYTLHVNGLFPPPVLNCTNVSIPCGAPMPNPPTVTDPCCSNVTVSLIGNTTINSGCNKTIYLTWLATDCCSNSTICTQIVSVVSGNTLVVPGTLASVAGPTVNAYPFDIADASLSSMRYQQVYAASEFAPVPPGGTKITAIAFRRGAGYGSFGPATLPAIQINLSTTAKTPDSLSSTFASNPGADDTVVFNGSLMVSSFSGGSPPGFDIVIPLTTPFFYNPAAGNLLMDVRNSGGGQTVPMDAVGVIGDSVSRVFNPSVSATVGGGDTIGLVTQFTLSTSLAPPVLNCSNLTVSCNSPVPTNPPSVIAAPCCTNVTVNLISSVTTSIGCGQLITRTWQAVDCCTNIATCTQTVTVVPAPPTLLCSNFTISCGTPVPTNPPGVIDLCCTNVTVSLIGTVITTNGCGQVIRRTWQAVDCCTNSVVCTQTVTITASPLAITCASNKVVPCGTAWSFDPPGAASACCTNVTVLLLSSNHLFTSSCSNVWQGVWRATDCCSNSANCTQTVTVVACAPPPSGMVAWYRLSEPNGATAVNDSAGFNNQGTPKPGGSLGSPNGPNAVAGEVGGALSFGAGDGTYVDVPDQAELNFGQGDLSMDAWVKLPNTGSVYETPIVEKMDRAGVGKGYYFHIITTCPGSGSLRFDIGDGSTSASYATGCIVPTDNNWHHVGVTVSRSSGLVTFYVDGAATAFGAPPLPTGNINNTLSLLIRATRVSGPIPGPISIDELELFNRALAALEIQAIVRAGPAGKCASPKLACVGNKTVPCGSTWSFDPPTIMDPCCVTNQSFSQLGNNVTNGTPCAQAITRTWLYVDCCGYSNICSQTVTVVDTNPPVIVAVSAGGYLGCNPTNLPTDLSLQVTATDACSVVTIGVSHVDSGTPCNMSRNFTITASDACTNTTTTNVVYTWTADTNPPVLIPGVIGPCYKTTTDAQVAALLATTVTDNCSTAVQLIIIASTVGSCPATVTVKATDACGNMASIAYNTRIDSTPPVLNCTNLTILCGTPVPTNPPSASDACCTNVTVSLIGQTTNSASCSQVISFVWQAVDCCTNISTCTQTVTVVASNTACTPLLARPGLVSITVWESTGVSSPYTFTANPANPALQPIPGGPNPTNNDFNTPAQEYYDLYISDPDGTPDINGCCVTVVCDYTGPGNDYATGANIDSVELDFPGNVHVGASSVGNVQLGGGLTDPVLLASDGLAYNALGLHDGPDTYLGKGITRITLCFPADCINAKSVACNSSWNFDPPAATSACCGTNVTVSILNTFTNGASCPKVVTRTWLITDCCSNKTTCAQNVTLVDTNPPVIVSVPTGGNLGCNPASLPSDSSIATQVIATDACTAVTITVTHVDGGAGCNSNRAFTITASDACTNTATANVTYTWTADTTAPVLNCSNVTITCGSPVPTNRPSATDACCTNVTVSLIASVTNSTGCGQVITRTWQAVDCCTNIATCTQTVTIVASPPLITCASNKLVPCGTAWSFDPPGVFSSCCTNVTYSLLSSNQIFGSSCSNVWQGVWKATDCCSNSATCTQTVTVVACAPPPSGMVAWYRLNESIGATAVNDSAGFNNQGTPGPGGSLGSPNGPNAVAGEVGGALSFGTGDGTYVNVPDQAEINFGQGDLSMDAWIKLPNTSFIYETPIVEKMDRSGVGKGYYFYILVAGTGSGSLRFDIRDGTTASAYATGNIVPTDNNWHHVGVTVSRSSGRVTFYLDGAATILTTPALPVGNINNTLSLLIRANRISGNVPAAISIDELELFNRALAALEIQAIFRAGPAGKCASPKLACVGNKTVPCGSTWSFDPPTIMDPCCVTNQSFSQLGNDVTTGTPCTSAITRTWLYVDCCGYSNICSQTVTVVDTNLPVFVNCTNLMIPCSQPVPTKPPTAFDPCCPVTVSLIGRTTNGTGCSRVVSLVWKSTNCCTNSTVCTQLVSYIAAPPKITCGPTRTLLCPTNLNLIFSTPVITDACCGTNVTKGFTTVTNSLVPLVVTRTWIATNCCGLTNSCSQTIHVLYTSPPNDECTNAIALNVGTYCGTTLCATPSVVGTLLPVNNACYASSKFAPDVWYTFTPACNGQVTIDTCGMCTNAGPIFNTVLEIYTGPCGFMQRITCNDNAAPPRGPCGQYQSRVTFFGTAGVTYYIRVAGYGTASGDFRLDINQVVTSSPVNDLCANATPVSNGSYPFSTCGANTDGPTNCLVKGDVWFRFQPSCSGTVTVDTCKSIYDTSLGVYSGSCPSLTLVACNDNATAGPCAGGLQSYISFVATANTTYYFRVGSPTGAPVSGSLTVIGPLPALGTCPPPTGPCYFRYFQITGPPNNTPWAWTISAPCCAHIQSNNVPGVPSGDANTLAFAFAASINAACPGGGGVALAYGYPAPNAGIFQICVRGCTNPPAPFVFRVGPAGSAENNQCVVANVSIPQPGTALPTVGLCAFNPEIMELPVSGHDLNGNGVDDAIDILVGTSQDINGDGIPDEVQGCIGPVLTSYPEPLYAPLGSGATLSASAVGTAALGYHWSLGGMPLTDDGNVSGSASSTLTIMTVGPSNLGDYVVTVTNACGMVSSLPATLSDGAPLLINVLSDSDGFQFSFATISGLSYVVEYTEDLTAPTSWTALTIVDGDGNVRDVVDPYPVAAARYYRARLLGP